jgi:hypothetical protein
MLIAYGQAAVTSRAGGGIEGNFHCRFFAFGIVAPDTGKRASFEKNHRANPRPVIQRIAFDVQNQGG